MTTSNTKLTKKNERGIALIFTLIMLSLLMILAMSFAMDSMFSQKAAYNSASRSSAALLAKSQFNKVFALIDGGASNYDADYRIYSYDKYTTLPVDMDTDMLKERLPVPFLLPENDPCLTTPNVKWDYTRKTASPTSEIIGRVAFVVVPDDQIPLDSLVDHRAGYSYYPKQDEKSNTEPRIGRYVSEINVCNAIPAVTNNIDSICEALNFEDDKPVTGAGQSNGKYDGNWLSYSNLFTIVNAAVGASFSANDESEIIEKLSLDISKDKEAFWADLVNDSELDEASELFKRFDLNRSRDSGTNYWDCPDTASDLLYVRSLLGTNSGTSPGQAMVEWKDEVDPIALPPILPWLGCFGLDAEGNSYTGADLTKVKGTFTGANAIFNRRCQIAANLLDYSDSDNRPSSDQDTEKWHEESSIHPTFTGNEKTPYIDKIGFEIEVKRYNAPGVGIWPAKTHIYTRIKPHVGLINIYGADYGSASTIASIYIKIHGSITTQLSLDGGTTYGAEETVSFDNMILTYNYDDWSGGYSKLISGIEKEGHRSWDGISGSTAVKITNLKITKVVLYESEPVPYDYVQTLEINSDFVALPDTSSDSTKNYWVGFGTHDPRQNLNPDDWKELPITETTDASAVLSINSGYCAPNCQNSSNGGGLNTDAPNAGTDDMDKEATDDPANCNLSTAFVRNGPIQSPWELGFIHRGAKWQTINLKKYDSSKAIKTFTIGSNKYIAGGGLYKDGDANILDQIKMNHFPENPQKITLKSPQNKIFDTLLSKIKYGCTIRIDSDSDPTKYMNIYSFAGLDHVATGSIASGTELSKSEITSLGTRIINKFKNYSIEHTRTRACIADRLLLSASSIPALTSVDDAGQEELIGKIINLVKIGSPISNSVSTSFSVIILAQSIKDMGGIRMTKYSIDGSSSDTQDCVTGTFDAKINDPNDLKTNIYFDEITGEQKIIVRCKTDSTGNVSITSFKYVD